jgi:hypothetical protein
MAHTIKKENIEDVFPMSDIEKGLMFHSIKDSAKATFYSQTYYIFKDPEFNSEILDKAIVLMVEKHPILRTGFDIYNFKEPVQIVFKKITPNIAHTNISHLEKQEQEQYVDTILSNEKKIPFDINQAEPLWRIRTFVLDEENICFVWINHHAIFDGWSFSSFITELNNTYLQLKSNPDFIPQKLKSTYKDFVIEQMKEKKNPENIDYWKRYIKGFKKLIFPKIERKENTPDKHIHYSENLGQEFLEELNITGRKYNTSTFTLCFAAYVYMLHIYFSEDDICVGIVSDNRPLCEDGEKILGCFVNEIPFRVLIPNKIKWSDYIFLIDEKLRELKKYDRLSLFEIVRLLNIKSSEEKPIFDTVFILMDFHIFKNLDRRLIDGNEQDGLEDKFSLKISGTVDSGLTFGITMYNGIYIDLSYSNQILNNEIIELLCSCFKNILNMFIHQSEEEIDETKILSDEDQKKFLNLMDAKASIDDIDFMF